ncbi:hypothetical protein L596_008556 [Steinernema carpocapsae]|uniref:Uncharacterized protein n=1 Tax=Steinernema carpocapsae TaxID=34508 RepID=A0A4U5PDX7_STECR|nr:hypothetical protein L596_008556 [Steinernema carpocapsae]
MLIWAVSGLKGRGRFRSKRFSVLLVFEDPEGLLISIDRRFLSKVRFPTFRLSLCRRSLAHRQQPQPFSTLSSPASSDRSDDSNRIRMTSRIQNVSPNAAHFDSIPPSASTASANPHQANPTDLTTPKKFEKHARRSWRRSSAHRPHNAPSPSQGFAGMSLIQVQMPMPIDIVSGGPRVAGDPVEAVEELKECRSPSTLSTTSSSGIDSTGTNETGETVPHSNSDSALGEECPKLSDSDDVDSTSSFPGHFQAPPQHPFIPPQLLPFALCGVLPAVPSEEDLERFRFFRQQHNFYKNYFARQRRLNPNSISYAPTPPNPMQEYFFISYETMDSFLDYLEALYPQLTRSRSTTMQSSDESCCSMPATIQPRAEAAEPSIPFRYGVDSHPEAFPPFRYGSCAPPAAGPCSTTTTQSSRKTSIDSSHTATTDDVFNPQFMMSQMPPFSASPPGMPPVIVPPRFEASRTDLDYCRIFAAQFALPPNRRFGGHQYPGYSRHHRQPHHYPSSVYRTNTEFQSEGSVKRVDDGEL